MPDQILSSDIMVLFNIHVPLKQDCFMQMMFFSLVSSSAHLPRTALFDESKAQMQSKVAGFM
jgi:hypothetical protein